jgi:hypothetical protein
LPLAKSQSCALIRDWFQKAPFSCLKNLMEIRIFL